MWLSKKPREPCAGCITLCAHHVLSFAFRNVRIFSAWCGRGRLPILSTISRHLGVPAHLGVCFSEMDILKPQKAGPRGWSRHPHNRAFSHATLFGASGYLRAICTDSSGFGGLLGVFLGHTVGLEGTKGLIERGSQVGLGLCQPFFSIRPLHSGSKAILAENINDYFSLK